MSVVIKGGAPISNKLLIECCVKCGSSNVTKDALAEWCPDTQQWVLAALSDEGDYCRDCDELTTFEERHFILKYKPAADVGASTRS